MDGHATMFLADLPDPAIRLERTLDTVVERFFRDSRDFRIYDGPSEVHRWARGSFRGRCRTET